MFFPSFSSLFTHTADSHVALYARLAVHNRPETNLIPSAQFTFRAAELRQYSAWTTMLCQSYCSAL